MDSRQKNKFAAALKTAEVQKYCSSPLSRALIVSIAVSVMVASVLGIFCSTQYNAPGETFKAGGRPSSPQVLFDCPCFQPSALLANTVNERKTIAVFDPKDSCQSSPDHLSIHYHKVTSGGFTVNGSKFGFEADMRNGEYSCTASFGDGRLDEKNISKQQANICYSLIKEACMFLGATRY